MTTPLNDAREKHKRADKRLEEHLHYIHEKGHSSDLEIKLKAELDRLTIVLKCASEVLVAELAVLVPSMIITKNNH